MSRSTQKIHLSHPSNHGDGTKVKPQTISFIRNYLKCHDMQWKLMLANLQSHRVGVNFQIMSIVRNLMTYQDLQINSMCVNPPPPWGMKMGVKLQKIFLLGIARKVQIWTEKLFPNSPQLITRSMGVNLQKFLHYKLNEMGRSSQKVMLTSFHPSWGKGLNLQKNSRNWMKCPDLQIKVMFAYIPPLMRVGDHLTKKFFFARNWMKWLDLQRNNFYKLIPTTMCTRPRDGGWQTWVHYANIDISLNS